MTVLHWLASPSNLPRWLELLSIIATAGAAVLAWLAIKQTQNQAKKSADALVRERRIDFELDVLTELIDMTSRGHWANELLLMQARLQLLSEDEVARTRAAAGLTASEAASATVQAARRDKLLGSNDYDAVRDFVGAELRAAVSRRLEERSDAL